MNSLTYVVRWTASTPAAIAVLEIRGPNALGWLAEFWTAAQGKAELTVDRIRFGTWRSKSSGVGEQVVVCRTGPESVEVHCHGGVAASTQIMTDLASLGCQSQSVEQALVRESQDDYCAAASIDLCRAKTVFAAGVLMAQMQGAFSMAIATVRQLHSDGYPEAAAKQAQLLLDRSNFGCHLTVPWRIVLAGPPNVGKSSLMNAMLGYHRAIVHPTAGTTRDLIEEETSLGGWPVAIVDMAGLRETNDPIEQAGVQAAMSALEGADCILLLVDPVSGWTDFHKRIYNQYSNICLIVSAKCDIPFQAEQSSRVPADVETSATTGKGLSALFSLLIRRFLPTDYPVDDDLSGYAVPIRKIQVEELLSLLNYP